MKKSLIVASLLALGTTSVSADSLKQYVGIGLGVAGNEFKASDSDLGISASDRTSSFLINLKAGAIYDDMHRLSLNYKPAIHSDAVVHNFLVSYDLLIQTNSSDSFFVGASAGGASVKFDSLMSDWDMSGFAYGAQTGYILGLSDDLELEFSVGYTKYSIDKTYDDLKMELKDSISALVGLNYKF